MTEIMKTAIVTRDSVTVVVNGNTRVVNDSHPAYAEIREAVRAQEWEKVPGLLDVKSAVKQFMERENPGKVQVENEFGRLVVKYDGQVIRNYLSDRIVQLMREGFDASPLVNFLENVKENPSKRAVDDLFEFIEKGNIPFTPEGYIMAYKNVNSDFYDIHSGTVLQKPAELMTSAEKASLPKKGGNRNEVTTKIENGVTVVEMVRNEVNENPDQTCSHGLHFCSQSYLPSFGGNNGVTLLVRVHPRDVVAFPSDYGKSKVRCCRYEVVDVHKKGVETTAYTKPVETRYTLQPKAETQEEVLGTMQSNIGRVVSVKEAARIFGCTESAVRKRCQRGASARWAGHRLVEILQE